MTSTQKNHHPPLSGSSIIEMLHKNRPNFYVKVKEVFIVYVLSHPNNAWDVCECGYTTGSPQFFQQHKFTCQFLKKNFDITSIDHTNPQPCAFPHTPMTESQYNDLQKKGPIVGYCVRNKRRFLRLHGSTLVACVCGMQYNNQRGMEKHQTKCNYMKSFLDHENQSNLILNEDVVPLIESPKIHYKTPIHDKISKPKLINFDLPVKVFPNNISGSTIMVPSPSSSPIVDIANRLQRVFNSNYHLLIELIDHPPAEVTESAWGGTRIQAGRIMLRLCADSEGGNACLVAFLKKVQFPETSIIQLINKAKKLTKKDDNNKDKNQYHNFYLIVSNVKEQQEIHIDTITDNHQYGMPITNGVDSTIIYNVNKIPMNKQSTTVNNLVQMFMLPDYLPKDILPGENCFNKILGIEADSVVATTLLNYGILFNIINKTHIEQVTCDSLDKTYFDYESCYVSNCTAGTVSSTSGGVAHAGSGSANDIIRIVMFWTAYNKDNHIMRYNSDDQITKLTMIIDITLHLWSTLNVEEEVDLEVRKQLIGLIYFFLFHSSKLYQASAPSHYVASFHLHEMMQEMRKIMKKQKTSKINNNKRYSTMCNTYALVNLSLSDSSDEESDGNKKQKIQNN